MNVQLRKECVPPAQRKRGELLHQLLRSYCRVCSCMATAERTISVRDDFGFLNPDLLRVDQKLRSAVRR